MKNLIPIFSLFAFINCCSLERVVAPLDQCFNPVDIDSFEIHSINGNNIVVCPSNSSLPCQFQVTGTVKHYMECPLTHLYLVINSIEPSEGIWHIQQPAFERIVNPHSTQWKLIGQFGDTFDNVPQKGNIFKIKAILSDQEIKSDTLASLSQLSGMGIQYSESPTLEVMVEKEECFEGSSITDIVIQKIDGATATTSTIVNCPSEDTACSIQIGGRVNIDKNLCPLFIHLLVQPLSGGVALYYIQEPPLEISTLKNWSGPVHLGSDSSPPRQNEQFRITAIISDQSSRISDLKTLEKIVDLETKHGFKYKQSPSYTLIIDKTQSFCIDFNAITNFSIINPANFSKEDCPSNDQVPCRIDVNIDEEGLFPPICEQASILILVQPPGITDWFIQDDPAVYNNSLQRWEAIAQLGGTGSQAPEYQDTFKLRAIYTEYPQEVKELSPIPGPIMIALPHLLSDQSSVIVQK